MIFQSFAEFMVGSQGELVYHLVTLIAIQLILIAAVGHWVRNRYDPIAVRVVAAGLAHLVARVLLMFVALASTYTNLAPAALLPPLERFLDVVAVLVTAWAFLPLLREHSRLGVVLLLLTFLAVLTIYALFAYLWPAAEAQSVTYGGFGQEQVWEVIALAILGLAFVGGLARRGDDWGLLACFFTLLLVGHILQLARPIREHWSTVRRWVRLWQPAERITEPRRCSAYSRPSGALRRRETSLRLPRWPPRPSLACWEWT
jgi:hypothetical protein